MEQIKKNKRIELIAEGLLLAAFIAAVLFIGWHHEPWSDEAQSWLIARDCTWRGIFSAARYETSPPLWHLVLKLFITCGLKYRMIFIVPAAFSACGAALLLFGTDIPLGCKALTVFSYFPLYQLAVVARSYCLLFPLLIGIAIVYKKRYEKPALFFLLLFLTACTSSYGVVIAGSFAVLEVFFFVGKHILKINTSDYKPSKKYFISFGVFIAVVMLPLSYCLPPEDVIFVADPQISFTEITRIIVRSFATESGSLLVNTIVSAAIIAFFAVYFRGHILRPLLSSGMLFLFMFVVYSKDWHMSCLFLLVAALMIIYRPQANKAKHTAINIGLCALLLVQVGCGLNCAVYDVKNTYSSSKAAAEFLSPYIEDGYSVSALDFSGTSVEPYFDSNIYVNHPGSESYYYWSSNNGYNYELDGTADIYVLSDETAGKKKKPQGYAEVRFEGEMCFKTWKSEKLDLVLYVREAAKK